MKRQMEDATPAIRPVKVNGEDFYICLVHPLQLKSLRGEAAWLQAQREANKRGNQNPIFSGAEGIWNGVVLHKYQRTELRTGANGTTPSEGFKLSADRTTTYHADDTVADGRTVCRALFLGAQAGVLGWGQNPAWREELLDVGRKQIVGIDMIYGTSKTRFQTAGSVAQEDYGVYACDTQVIVD